MAATGFRVDPDKLSAVADEVHELMRLMNGDAGYVAGNLQRYSERATDSVLRDALASFWDGEDVFATAYSAEHQGVVQTMTNMVQQLTLLEQACRATAEQYKGQDQRSTQTVQRSGAPVRWK